MTNTEVNATLDDEEDFEEEGGGLNAKKLILFVVL